MKDLIIIGASGAGREVYNMASECDGYNKEWRIKGFLDDNIHTLDQFSNYPSILSKIVNYTVAENDVFICSIGTVSVKKKVINLILSKGGHFLNLIHPTANISKNVKLGIGSIIAPYSFISCEVKIGNYVTIQSKVVLGHDVSVGDYCHLGAFAFIGGNVFADESVTVYPGGILLPGIRANRGAIVGAGSVVIRDIPSFTTVFGMPATRL